jgi:hypothetical protein
MSELPHAVAALTFFAECSAYSIHGCAPCPRCGASTGIVRWTDAGLVGSVRACGSVACDWEGVRYVRG